MDWVKTHLLTKSAAALTAGIQAGGTLAGNAIGSAGTAIENTGRGVGSSTSGAINGVGERIIGYGEWVRGSMATSSGGSSGGMDGGGGRKTTAPVKNTTTTTTRSPASSAATATARDKPGATNKKKKKIVADNLASSSNSPSSASTAASITTKATTAEKTGMHRPENPPAGKQSQPMAKSPLITTTTTTRTQKKKSATPTPTPTSTSAVPRRILQVPASGTASPAKSYPAISGNGARPLAAGGKSKITSTRAAPDGVVRASRMQNGTTPMKMDPARKIKISEVSKPKVGSGI